MLFSSCSKIVSAVHVKVLARQKGQGMEIVAVPAKPKV